MDHYACKGQCGAVSDQPGVCQAGDDKCSMNAKAFEKCECGDDNHGKHSQEQSPQQDAPKAE